MHDSTYDWFIVWYEAITRDGCDSTLNFDPWHGKWRELIYTCIGSWFRVGDKGFKISWQCACEGNENQSDFYSPFIFGFASVSGQIQPAVSVPAQKLSMSLKTYPRTRSSTRFSSPFTQEMRFLVNVTELCSMICWFRRFHRVCLAQTRSSNEILTKKVPLVPSKKITF